MKPFSRYLVPFLVTALVVSLVGCLVALSGSRGSLLPALEAVSLCCLILLSLMLLAPARYRRRSAAEALAEERRHLAAIINLLPDATWAVDAGGTVIAWNRAIAELTGVRPEEIVGQDDYAYAIPFYGERRPILVDVAMTPDPEQEMRYDSFRRAGDTVEAEIFIPHFGTGGVFIWARARRLLDAAGTVIGAIETVRDITERKRMQEIMMQTEKMLTVGGLAAGMAHEINNPLAAILQNIQNLQRRLSPGLAANDRVAAEFCLDFEAMQCYLKRRGIFELLAMVEAAGTRVAGIVEKMMFFSHRESALLEAVRLDELLDQAVDLVGCDYDLKKRCDFRGEQIVREYDPAVPAVVMNRNEMEQAMINLLRNAVDALVPSREGETPRITIRTVLDGSWACVEIEDNGCGMTPEVRRRLFEPFYTTKKVGVGTGLGMAVAYAVVVKKHHGGIKVDSTPGRGSKISVRLPVMEGRG